MWDSLSGHDIAIMFVASVAGIAFVAGRVLIALRVRRETYVAAELKLEMIKRGMSADEIEQVLDATPAMHSAVEAEAYV
jgi:hypothetical protein